MSQDPRTNPTGPPDGNKRRQNDRAAGESASVTHAELDSKLTEFRVSTIENINNRFQLLGSQILSRLDDLDKSIKSGFPGGDAAEHRKEHERQIKIANERNELYKSIKEKVITSGIWGLLVLLGLAAWEYIKQNLK